MHYLAIAGHSEEVKQGGKMDTGVHQLIPDLQNLNSCDKRLVEGDVLGEVVYRGNSIWTSWTTRGQKSQYKLILNGKEIHHLTVSEPLLSSDSPQPYTCCSLSIWPPRVTLPGLPCTKHHKMWAEMCWAASKNFSQETTGHLLHLFLVPSSL